MLSALVQDYDLGSYDLSVYRDAATSPDGDAADEAKALARFTYGPDFWPEGLPDEASSHEGVIETQPAQPAVAPPVVLPKRRPADIAVRRHDVPKTGRSAARKPYPRTTQIALGAPMLAPMAHTKFCLAYRDDCKVPHVVFRGGPVKMTEERWQELSRINLEVNREIIAEPNLIGLSAETWLISPERGDCNDYAVTKRHKLLALGWPAQALLLAEVVVPSGEHHLILVVRTDEGDFLADNLSATIRPWTRAPYQWVRIQSPKNPNFWASVSGGMVVASLR
jgi:predicted transglutaminase-like cysteine proteinase